MHTDSSSCRLDVWLWRARFFKTRALSAKACESGHIRLERFGKVGRVEKASAAIRPDDHLIFAIGTRLFDIVVVDTGDRRGPASEAQSLYRAVNTVPDTAANASN
ncbi:RNA-binding S4 domain-containing protein [Asticcacaulis sp. 201]|uniref:RNA-binding S4 domain-containing protein n=1 Tax=Asticcacaulis sp. 201 TaxID=3028787 RepID=UPI0029160746|nr:RNA-binding S4 domain-containing protein [Asticcacaulis sp. 201]MDV6330416.1 RNA-binding S4 domain-containing protein [Asticcacaulis sp. 201]